MSYSTILSIETTKQEIQMSVIKQQISNQDQLFVYDMGLFRWNPIHETYYRGSDLKLLTFKDMDNGSTVNPTDQDYFDLTVGKEVIVHSGGNSYRGVLTKVQNDFVNTYWVYDGDNFIEFSFRDMVNSEQARMTEIINLKG